MSPKESESFALRALRSREFMARLSHEVHTPLTAILGSLEVLGESRLSTEQLGPWNAAEGATRQLSRLLDSLLNLCEVETDQVELMREPVLLSELVPRLLRPHEQRARQTGLEFRLELDVALDEERHLAMDSLRLAQVMDELVDNALRFTSDGSVKVRVRLKPYPGEGANLLFSVEDSGQGFLPEETSREELFNSFFSQGLASGPLNSSMTGFGLAIASRLVEKMGGSLEYTSQPGVGSKFWLKVDVPYADNEAIQASQGRAAERAMRRKSRIDRIPPCILVAEDNAFNRQYIAGALAQIPCDLKFAEDGEEALEMARALTPDLILMDLDMPKRDGFSATRAIRDLGGTFDQVPIVAVTANSALGDRQRCFDSGMDDFLRKPVELAQLRAKIEDWLSTSSSGPDLAHPVESGSLRSTRTEFYPRSSLPPSLLLPISPLDELEPLKEPEAAQSGKRMSLASSLFGVPPRELEPHLDVKRLSLLCDGEDTSLLKELSALFIGDLYERVEQLSQFSVTKELDSAMKVAHAIKGASANFGAAQLYEWSSELEEMCRLALSDPGQTEAALSLLTKQSVQMKEELQTVRGLLQRIGVVPLQCGA
jgi:CheY-like chemotaxis protein/HPt (histidine-containing phosphotransfer) domain-containing protein